MAVGQVTGNAAGNGEVTKYTNIKTCSWPIRVVTITSLLPIMPTGNRLMVMVRPGGILTVATPERSSQTPSQTIVTWLRTLIPTATTMALVISEVADRKFTCLNICLERGLRGITAMGFPFSFTISKTTLTDYQCVSTGCCTHVAKTEITIDNQHVTKSLQRYKFLPKQPKENT